MPSRLSSLLVRDGLVGVKRMEKAFQRQVIYGGSLDTILLEMNLVPEDRLVQYLALASGLPPAARSEGSVLEDAAIALLSREQAERYRAVPVAIEGEAVRMLVCAPLEISELEDLADLLDRPLQPLITPEYRWHLVYASAYALDPPARYTTLSRSLEVDPSVPAVGRAQTVIVEDTAPMVRASQPRMPTIEIGDLAGLSAGDNDAPFDRAAAEAQTIKLLTDPGPPTRKSRPTIIGVIPPAVTFGAPRAASGSSIPPAPATPVSLPIAVPSAPILPPAVRNAASPIATTGRDAPLPVVRARELLGAAADRDSVFLTLLRAARSRARWAGLLTVQGGAAIGRVALAEAGLDTSGVTSVLIPLDVVSPFRTVVSTHQSHIGPLVSGDPGIDAMVLRLGGTMPPSALVLPLVLRDRVVAIVVAHRVHSDIRLADVAELLPMATAASDALGRLIVKHKVAGRAHAGDGAVELEAENAETVRIARAPTASEAAAALAVPAAGSAHAPAAAAARPAPLTPSPVVHGVELSMDADPPRPIDELVDEIERAPESGAEELIDEALDRAGETLGALMRRFPGALRVDRFAVSGRALRAAQYGGLLELVIRLGSVASELLIEKMGAPQRDVRFYATVCTAELRPRSAVFALAERLFDQDFGVRAAAIEALSGYPVQDLGHALVRARRAVHSTDPEVVGAAASALVELGDVDAIADLIGVIERADRGGDHARRALIALTAQDFGTAERKWRKWHDAARRRHRIEWLIDGLLHKDDAIREIAIHDLRRLTGEYFGYHHDLPRRERDLAAERWAAWWRDTGQRRFGQPNEDAEKHRQTARIPRRE